MEITSGQQSWLQAVIGIYSNLDDSERNVLLERLMAMSSDSQEHHMKNILAYLDSRVDFISCLPLELTSLILSYLDIITLLNCTQVCKNWSHVISSLDQVWLHYCQRLGINTDVFLTKLSSKSVSTSKICNKMETAKEFAIRMHKVMKNSMYQCTLNDIEVGNSGLIAIHLWENTLFVASFGGITIYDLKDPTVAIISIAATGLSNVRGDGQIIIASFKEGILRTWNRMDLEMELQFGRHYSPVISFDFDHEMDLLVSGSTDGNVKIFSLRTAIHRRTLRRHLDWVSRISIYKSATEELLFTMGPNELLMWKFGCSEENPQNRWQELTCLNVLYNVEDSLYYTPGLHFDGRFIFYMEQAKGHPKLCKFDVQSKRLANQYLLNVKVWKLFSVGQRYACFLGLVSASGMPRVIALDLQTMTTVASWEVPNPRQSNADIEGICLGENRWLRDGYNGFNNEGIILAVAPENTQGIVSILRWQTDNGL